MRRGWILELETVGRRPGKDGSSWLVAAAWLSEPVRRGTYECQLLVFISLFLYGLLLYGLQLRARRPLVHVASALPPVTRVDDFSAGS